MRDELDLFLVEGEKMALELIKLKVDSIDSLYGTVDFIKQIPANSDFYFEEITEKELAQISTLKTPNKVLVVCKKWDLKDDSIADFYIALDEIQDPGNLGTIIRLADWFGVKNIVCSKNTADCFNPKVVQATMGSLFRVNIVYEDLKTFIETKKLPVYGAFLEGESIYKSSLSPKGILVLGNEGKGISNEIEKCVTQKITIPRFGEAESLNVSVATGILLSEFFRGN
ncbi:MAG: RNA methyltransferase [Bacteroidota bacterium]